MLPMIGPVRAGQILGRDWRGRALLSAVDHIQLFTIYSARRHIAPLTANVFVFNAFRPIADEVTEAQFR